MADSNIKKVTIPKEYLPSIDGNSFTYNVRFRLISEDKNRISHWSKIFQIDASQSSVDEVPLIPTLQYNYVKENTTTSSGILKSVRLNWIVPTQYSYLTTFDVYVNRKTSEVWSGYSYAGTAYTNSYTIFQTGTETDIIVLVQTPTYPKEIVTQGKLFETVDINI